LETNPKSKIPTILEYNTIQIAPGTPSPQSLIQVKNILDNILVQFRPDLSCVENLYFAQNKTTGQRVFETRGVILLALGEKNIPIVEPTATQVKKGMTGNGKADKKDIYQALKLLFQFEDKKGIDDSWDAIAVAYVGINLQHHSNQVLYVSARKTSPNLK
jgi:crossover junction endodeoxyribonuclease RuvC